MARARKTVQLKYPFDGGGEAKVTEVVLEEPSAGDYFTLGSPQTWVRSKDGMALVDNDDAIRAYAERLIVEPNALIAMRHMHVLDAIRIKNAIVDFFSEPVTTQSG